MRGVFWENGGSQLGVRRGGKSAFVLCAIRRGLRLFRLKASRRPIRPACYQHLSLALQLATICISTSGKTHSAIMSIIYSVSRFLATHKSSAHLEFAKCSSFIILFTIIFIAYKYNSHIYIDEFISEYIYVNLYLIYIYW